jgi:outer membrane lipoprotein SlyB
MFRLFSILTVSLFLTACAKDIRPEAYSDQQVGETAETFQGVIVQARDVVVTAGDETGAGPGTLLGGIGGGVAGNQFGRGSGNVAATAGGVVLGGVLGTLAERQLKKQPGVEYVVKLADGSLKTVVQAPEPRFTVNQRVFLLVSRGGRSRLMADQSAAGLQP